LKDGEGAIVISRAISLQLLDTPLQDSGRGAPEYNKAKRIPEFGLNCEDVLSGECENLYSN
jgi:hypothetical protein